MSIVRHILPALAAACILATPATATEPSASDACALVRAGADAPLVELPFRTVDGRIYLEVAVNGDGPFLFALDTGASGLGRIDASLVAQLGLPEAGQDEASDGMTSAAVDRVMVKRLALGALEHRDMRLIARDYRSRMAQDAWFSGILGRAFFADGLLAIDFPAKRLAFYDTRAMPADRDGALTYDRAFRVPLHLGDLATTGNIDTGANITLVLPQEVFASLGGSAAQPAGNANLTNTKVASSTATLAGDLRIGAMVLTDPEVRVVDGYPEVLVGAHALQDQVVLIDQRHATLALCPSSSG